MCGLPRSSFSIGIQTSGVDTRPWTIRRGSSPARRAGSASGRRAFHVLLGAEQARPAILRQVGLRPHVSQRGREVGLRPASRAGTDPGLPDRVDQLQSALARSSPRVSRSFDTGLRNAVSGNASRSGGTSRRPAPSGRSCGPRSWARRRRADTSSKAGRRPRSRSRG